MVVVVVLGILATMIVRGIAGQDEEARVARARSDISTLRTAVDSFRLNMRRYPTEEEGLAVLREPPQGDDASLWRGPYISSDLPSDPWGNPYYYYVPAPNGIDPFGIESLGADGAAGGEGFARDINSWSNYDDQRTD